MTNFYFLQSIPEYAMFAPAAIEAERVYATSPAMCAVGCRKALELGVKWVYAADNTMQTPYKNNLQSLIHEPSFRFALDRNTWDKLPYIIKLGNLSVHTERSVTAGDDVAALLETKINIPQVKAKLPVIQEIASDAFWDANDVLALEKVRQGLRSLMQFLMDKGSHKTPVFTRLSDPIIDQQEGVLLDPAYDFEDYRAKVNRYINEHGDTLAIYKLTHNIPLSVGDYTELERILTDELGSKEDYTREFGDTPFGLLVRKIAKMDHEAAMKAFSDFISDQALTQQQIAFVYKVIHHIEQNGYMESVVELRKPPFDKPVSFIKLFDADKQQLKLINAVKDNAIYTVA